jgi:long-chain acyl-CoA synthetase
VIVPNAPTLTEADVLAHCKRHLTGYKVPRVIEFRSAPLPKSSIGKILRRELGEGAASSPAESVSSVSP